MLTGDGSSDALQEELQELKEALEEKSREADDSMDRYCSLMVKVHKLEETNESLKSQLKQLNTQTKTPKSRRSLRSEKSDVENNKPVEDTKSVPAGKRQRAVDDTPSKEQEALHSITKRLKAVAATPKATQDDEDFRPEGLPELVQKGEMFSQFAKRLYSWHSFPHQVNESTFICQLFLIKLSQSREEVIDCYFYTSTSLCSVQVLLIFPLER